MESRNKIVKFCEDYLKVKDFTDYCHNGLQVEGSEEINKIITGVSFSRKLIEKANPPTGGKKAQMIIVHHGIFGNQIPSPLQLKGIVKNRIKLILENDINLCGFHLPLDAHPIIGNNILLCKLLGVKKVKPFDVGFIGELDRQVDFKKFVDLVNKKLGVQSFVLENGKKQIKKAAIISGGSSPDFEKAARLGADVYICGDIREEVVRGTEEAGINLINAGHYNTEKLGIQNLGKLIAKKFKVKVEFVDIPCEV
ncbi:Nif3-like dinuclear metal center hexameric protein [Candidatus Falkowbacteria bacterium RIFOXYB2_FULL_34_18]|uniref:Nif3-like dinuclear metal center hexameric protein n=1 Tax=Candidatus Falkowbacteria bacterium RIFOXYD2_FULL_34_120 TaxID=1798007 RepID=A0A1F5TRU9_9BACT|nr:MAG: Nif3-like dinuclear metal center hexameric protein [Candidatus Falkowbacteria bacterium RIFOXYB2_FULL_34_18]OGF29921.1 MAG: Nif3-like dinuclear metal center hexameric protein [Candidatus Falkowbacteria bacterium RIFOXYC12_FULL_34_55]OGF37221.1 MAG: Nif3-like dinuclear metal center hexameric protein [Candidatus Falkowbacteria bacterium RIFOXYC2_FULL_34_220]OGF39459.1 MAG: Nif3-like dinuclear metal center hexameric protein [Candidatus Falkowbacteria bacterium RIFOXYD12_FULL_34_57]OGF41559